MYDRLARLQAEFDNYRKRAAKENADYRDFAVADAARALLPVIDSFSLALKNASARPEDLRKGVELIHKQLQDVLQKLNVERIPAQGEPFDPRVHEAIEMVESDAAPDHHVLEELQPGYRIKGRLLRPAMVKVAKKSNCVVASLQTARRFWIDAKISVRLKRAVRRASRAHRVGAVSAQYSRLC